MSSEEGARAPWAYAQAPGHLGWIVAPLIGWNSWGSGPDFGVPGFSSQVFGALFHRPCVAGVSPRVLLAVACRCGINHLGGLINNKTALHLPECDKTSVILTQT